MRTASSLSKWNTGESGPRGRRRVKGLSSRARGNRSRILLVEHSERSILACTGEPRSAATRGYSHEAGSPHVRGDGPAKAIAIFSGTGSPPRAWGRQGSRPGIHDDYRFTPTCVGTAKLHRPGDDSLPVHPHVRGDGAMIRSSLVSSFGSPPRAWGRRNDTLQARHVVRFTPTCVGTAGFAVAMQFVITVHPHVRGDGDYGLDVVGQPPGSPPRAWGRLDVALDVARRSRFTPTCVGTAGNEDPATSTQSVHPHVRGDGHLCCII